MPRSKGFRKTCLPAKQSRTEPTPSTDGDYHRLRANSLHVLLCTCKDKKTIFSEVTLLCSLNTLGGRRRMGANNASEPQSKLISNNLSPGLPYYKQTLSVISSLYFQMHCTFNLIFLRINLMQHCPKGIGIFFPLPTPQLSHHVSSC